MKITRKLLKSNISMFKYTILFNLMLVSVQTIYGQFPVLEEQLMSVETHQEKVTTYVQLIDTLLWTGLDFQKAAQYNQAALQLCKEQPCDKKTLNWLQLYQAELSRNPEVIVPWLDSMLTNHTFEDMEFKAHLTSSFGSLLSYQGEYQNSVTELQKAKNILQKYAPKSKRLALVYYNLSLSYSFFNEDSSIYYMDLTIEESKKIRDYYTYSSGLHEKLSFYMNKHQYAEALILHKEIGEIMKKYPFDAAKVLYHDYLLGEIYNAQNKRQKCIETFLDFVPKVKNSSKISRNEKYQLLCQSYTRVSNLLIRDKKFEKGLRYLDSATVYLDYPGNQQLISVIKLIRLNAKIGLERFDEAEQDALTYWNGLNDREKEVLAEKVNGIFHNIYTMSDRIPNSKTIEVLLDITQKTLASSHKFTTSGLYATELKALIYLYKGDKKAVKNILQSYKEIQDTLHNRENNRISNELLVKYETREKEQQLEIQQVEISKKTLQRNLSFSLAFAFLMIAGLALMYYKQKRDYSKSLEQQVAERTADLQKANKELAQSNEELERFTYITSHDLKEPLRSVVSFVNLIKRRKLIKDESTLEYFDFIERGAKQMNNIVKDVLEFSGLRKMDVVYESVSIEAIIQNTKDTLREMIKTKGAEVQWNNLPDTIQSSQPMLFLIFKNLIENGIKYNNSTPPIITIDYEAAENNHIFKVSDNGIGIDKAYHQLIFKMFKRLHDRSKYDGSGIGLATCKKMVDYLNGTIEVESEEGKGATFIVILPK